MKVVAWNLKNLGNTKLGNNFNLAFSGYGLGGNVGTFITNLVMGSAVWNNIALLSTNPADIFVIIELKTAGHNKGMGVGGTCVPTLTTLVNAMNNNAFARYGHNNTHFYAYLLPTITGRYETVGVIYNTHTINNAVFSVYRNLTNNTWINPRTPGGARVMTVVGANTFRVIGIHSPPPSGGAAIKYRRPIQYSNLLQHSYPAGQPNSYFMGDFNCNPNSTYPLWTPGGMVNVGPFAGMVPAYVTNIPTPTLSSVRKKITNNFAPPASYLNDAYDNMIFNSGLTPANSNQVIVDMIGNTRNMNAFGNPVMFGANPATSAAILRAFNMVSDHLPVVMEW